MISRTEAPFNTYLQTVILQYKDSFLPQLIILSKKWLDGAPLPLQPLHTKGYTESAAF